MKQITKQNYCPQTLIQWKLFIELAFINFLSLDSSFKKFGPQLNYRDRNIKIL